MKLPRWGLWLVASFAVASATAGDARPKSLTPNLVALSVANVDAAITCADGNWIQFFGPAK